MNPPSADRLLGEYRLKELVSEEPLTRTWLAEQVSVSRKVLVCELKPECADRREDFLADVRAKAAVEHPLVASVYEAVAEPGRCFFAYELLPGATFADRVNAHASFKPARLAHLLRRIAEAHLQHEALGQATTPLRLEHIHVDDQGVIRLANLTVSGPRDAHQDARDIAYLGDQLRALLADGQAGATRMMTVLGWMRGEGLEAPIGWHQVRDIAGQIEQQLAGPPPPASPTKSVPPPPKKSPLVPVLVVLLLGIAGGVLVVQRLRSKPAPSNQRPALPEAVLIPAGKHPTPDGSEESLQAFRISAHEVTIGQYAEFLDTLDTLSNERREKTFDHENQPKDKPNHVPDDWAALYAAAKSNGTWNKHPVSLDSPVVGIDWWDCSAYADWKQVRIATQEEWFAAMRHGTSIPAKLPPGPWQSVTQPTPDITRDGITGLAGSVAEWTRRPAVNPANPLGERRWVIIGGSHQKPGSNALSRQWTDNRSLRRPDLGFRIVMDAN